MTNPHGLTHRHCLHGHVSRPAVSPRATVYQAEARVWPPLTRSLCALLARATVSLPYCTVRAADAFYLLPSGRIATYKKKNMLCILCVRQPSAHVQYRRTPTLFYVTTLDCVPLEPLSRPYGNSQYCVHREDNRGVSESRCSQVCVTDE